MAADREAAAGTLAAPWEIYCASTGRRGCHWQGRGKGLEGRDSATCNNVDTFTELMKMPQGKSRITIPSAIHQKILREKLVHDLCAYNTAHNIAKLRV